MLGFFRKYQWYFFLVITVVTIISFSFFGSYGSLVEGNSRNEVAVTLHDGTKVPRIELDEATVFLGTDSDDKAAFGGAWGPNFLNDGVIKKDFLETGLAAILAEHYREEIAGELQTRLEKEKRYVAYAHPQAQENVSAEAVWGYFAPQIKGGLEALKRADNAADPEAFAQRVDLFLAEKQFPSSTLRQLLRYQQRQHQQWLTPDQDLDYRDLSLFGYHTIDDWFGPSFVKLVAQFIMNAAKTAESRGYKVSKAEALADLTKQVDASYQQTVAANPNIGVATKDEFYREQLRRMGMDQAAAVRIWRQVLLFRRLFNDQSNATVSNSAVALADPEPQASAKRETVSGELYRLPVALQLNSFRDLQRFEVYLRAVASNIDEERPLSLPTAFLSADEVAKKYPELVEKRYVLEVAEVDKTALQSRVSVKETWNWEVENDNWETLKKEFPELGVKGAKTREERFAALEALDLQTRSRVDSFARKAITNLHPEWVNKALSEAKTKKSTVAIRLKGGTTPFSGVEDREGLIRLLDSGDATKLGAYTADKNRYYKIAVLEKGPGLELLSFAEATDTGALDPVVKRLLDGYYMENRHKEAALFQRADGNWKAIGEVQDEVANRYLENVLKAVRTDYLSTLAPKAKPLHDLNGDFLATVRLYSYMRNAKAAIAQNKPEAKNLFHKPQEKEAAEKITAKSPLANQWQLEQRPYLVKRGQASLANGDEVFALKEGAWSTVQTPLNGDLSFLQVQKKGEEEVVETDQQIHQSQRNLPSDMQRAMMRMMLETGFSGN
jgi:GcvH upstream region-like protein